MYGTERRGRILEKREEDANKMNEQTSVEIIFNHSKRKKKKTFKCSTPLESRTQKKKQRGIKRRNSAFASRRRTRTRRGLLFRTDFQRKSGKGHVFRARSPREEEGQLASNLVTRKEGVQKGGSELQTSKYLRRRK